MNNKLPKVFVNKIDKELKINQESTLSSSYTSVNLDEILDDKDKYLFNHRYLITLKNNTTLEDSIISKQNNKILTLDNHKIAIDDIKSITELTK